jgi:hypothetical protein
MIGVHNIKFFFSCTRYWDGGQGIYYKKNQFDEQLVFSYQLKKKNPHLSIVKCFDFFPFYA